MPTGRKILQIIPSDGWKARFKAEPFDDKPLVCWALVEMGLTSQIVGMFVKSTSNQSRPAFVDEEVDFVTYISD